MSRITPCLWFNDNAEEAARFYVSVFKQSRLGTITRYGEPGPEVSGRPKGSVMTATFEIDGQEFVALNGGPTFSTGGNAQAQQCGWRRIDTAYRGKSCRPCSSRCSKMEILEKPIASCKPSFR